MKTVSTFKALPPDSPVVPLGVQCADAGMHGLRFTYRTPSGRVVGLLAADHTRLNILGLFETDIPLLLVAFPRGTGAWAPEVAAAALMQAAAAQGIYTPPEQGGHDAGILAHLLFRPANCAREDYQDILLRLHRGQGSDADRRALGDAGMAYIDERSALAIAHNCQAIADAFRDTPWVHTHYPRLRTMPGAIDGAMARIGGVTRRCILIPMTTVAELMPEVPW